MVSNVENLNPQVMRYLTRELQALVKEPLEGITLVINDEDLSEVHAVIDGPAGTPYAGGKFRIKLIIGKDFPQSPPKGYFETKIFHPNVSDKGEICVNTLKRDWKSDLGIKHILLTVKCLLIVPNPESALNEEAGKMILEHYDDYCARARLYTEIHAFDASSSSGSTADASSASAVPADKKAGCKKEKSLKDKKKTLKRL
jgi:ubiquitin-conjugating enzyme E2 S